MKDSSSLEQTASTKRLPWRRRYQEAKVTNLLHFSQADDMFCHNANASTTSTMNGHSENGCSLLDDEHESKRLVADGASNGWNLSTENSKAKRMQNDCSDKIEICGSSNTSNCGEKKLEISSDTESSLVQKQNPSHRVVANTDIPNEMTSNESQLFQKYLFGRCGTKDKIDSDISTNGVSSQDLQKRNATMKKRCIAERRHTVSGLSPIKIKDIENWLSSYSNESEISNPLSNNESPNEDCMAETDIVTTKLAQNKTIIDWCKSSKNLLSSSGEKNHSVMHRWSHEERRNDSCHFLSNDFPYNSEATALQHTRPNRRSYSVLATRDENRTAHKDQFNKDSLLNSGINSRLSCFLTPRPYSKSSKWNAMAQSRNSWNGYDVIINSDEDRARLVHGYSGNDITRNGEATIDLEDSYDVLLQNQTNKKRSNSKYDTFLDLSTLNFEEETSSSLDESGESILTSCSGEYTNSEMEKCATEHQFEQQQSDPVSVNENSETVNQIVNEVLCEFLKQISEESGTIEDFQTISAAGLLTKGRSNASNKINVAADNVNAAETETLQNSNENSSDTGNLLSNLVTLDQMNNAEANSLQNEANQTSDTAAAKSNSSSEQYTVAQTPETQQTNTQSSLQSNVIAESDDSSNWDEAKEFSYTNTSMKKTTSLDRNFFLTKSSFHSKRRSMPGRLGKSSNSLKINNETKSNSTSLKDRAALRTGLQRLYQIAMSSVDGDRRPGVKIKDILDLVESKGIKITDPRMRESLQNIEKEPNATESLLNVDTFCKVFEPSFKFIRSILLSQLTIPGFSVFKLRFSAIFDRIQEVLSRHNDTISAVDPYSSYNLVMRKLRTSQPQIAVSICTVDGQRCSFGNSEIPQPLNACASVFNYCLACRQNGTEAITHFIGKRTKPKNKSEFMLEPSEKVWNPFTKSGSFVTSVLLFREMAIENRLNALHEFYGSLTGREPLCCDNLSYNYKRIYAHEETALAYYLSATQRLPKGTSADIADTIDFHFQAASSAMTSDACAVGAATLANKGVCPLTGEAVIDNASVHHTLHVMRSSFASTSSRSDEKDRGIAVAWNDHGSILLIVPGVLGLACFVQCQSDDFIEEVVDHLLKDLNANFNFSVYRSLKDKRNVMLISK